MKITEERFVAVWEKARSSREVAAFFHITVVAARTRAALYRQNGIKLKPLTSGKPSDS